MTGRSDRRTSPGRDTAAPDPAGWPESLADRQTALVAALVAGAPVPAGFDHRLIGVARAALLRKRAGEVARHWPLLAAGHGERWATTFAGWATGRPPGGGLRDGWDLARSLVAEDALPALAVAELAVREAGWRYDGRSAPRPRRLPAIRRADRSIVVQFAGRIRVLATR